MQTVLVTGAAGFIGFYVSKRLLEQGHFVIGYDNINDYYDVHLKWMRIHLLKKYEYFIFYQADICDQILLEEVVKRHKIQRIIHLAAQAGVRYSLENPEIYIESNIIGTFRILEVCRKFKIYKLMYASSSSVYGDIQEEKLTLDLKTDFPISLYAATKKTDELLAYTYSNNYGINTIGMRFFTVYGPYGRPDMAYFSFIDKILNDETIDIYNYGRQYRDFTYITDLLDGIFGIFQSQNDIADGLSNYKIYNIGNGNPTNLMTFVETLEKIIGKKARKNLCEKRMGDVERTYADITEIQNLCHYSPKFSIKQGLLEFYNWYQIYRKERIKDEKV